MADKVLGKVDKIEISMDNLKSLIKDAVHAGKKAERDKIKKNRYHNTGLLMKHYIDFLDFYEKIKYNPKEIWQDAVLPEGWTERNEKDYLNEYLENLDIDDVYDEINVLSIMKSKARTLTVITQVQTAMSMLKTKCEAKGEYEKYQLMKLLYMDREYNNLKFNERVIAISEKMNCHEATVRRWNNEMLNQLSIMLMGVDGLRMDT